MTAQGRNDGLGVGLGLLALLAWDASGIDLPAARWFGGPQGFGWREQWFFSQVLHNGGRWLALLVLALLAVNVRWPLSQTALGRWFQHIGSESPSPSPGLPRATRLWWFLSTLVCALLVPQIKQFSSTSCPWDLAEFGGAAQYLSHWRWGVSDGGPGRCFPSGHATSAFALFSGWFALRSTQPRWARVWLATVLVAGVVFGTAQWVRGAHYPSHTLWTAWLCWTLFSVAALWLPRQELAAADALLQPDTPSALP